MMARDIDLSGLQTEAINGRTSQIDRVSTLQMCTVINNEDLKVAPSVTPCLPEIAQAIDLLHPRVRRGGRVVYVGAGTSGRLGILDSSEILPTFAAPPTQFVGLIAGGDAAIRMAQEGAEDSPAAAVSDLAALNLDSELDSIIGIAASGRTPYVLGALGYAKSLGCLTIGVACVSPSAMGTSGNVDVMISPLPGPEILTGSTRLKAGTATKLVLNMLSTGTMIKVGKTYGNMMVDLIASNEKLKQRSRNILRKLSKRCLSLTDESLDDLLASCDGSVKLALVVVERGYSVEESRQILKDADGVLARVLALEHAGRYAGGSVLNRSKVTLPVLCVDGGGSKCAAAVGVPGTWRGQGIAGPCNLTDGHFDSTMDSIVSAVRQALKDFRRHTVKHEGDRDVDADTADEECLGVFSSVWIAAAGMDRPGMRQKVKQVLSQTLNLDSTTPLRITNDVDLLAAAMARHPGISSSIVLIAGTGSIAVRYAVQCDGEAPQPVARSGGWGHLLGDEGGGFAIGRQVIQQTLSSIEACKLGLPKATLTPLEKRMISIFGHSSIRADEEAATIDLLSEILTGRDDQQAKARIASAARAVLDAAGEGDAEATRIVSTEISVMIDRTLSRLLVPQSQGYVEPSQCGLIIAGGAMLHGAYQAIFHAALVQRGVRFAYTEPVATAALGGVDYLLSLRPSNGTH